MIFDFNDAIMRDEYVVLHGLKLFKIKDIHDILNRLNSFSLMKLSENIDSIFENDSVLTIQDIYKVDGRNYEFQDKKLTGNYCIYLDNRKPSYQIERCCRITVFVEYINKDIDVLDGGDEDMFIDYLDVDVIDVKNFEYQLSMFVLYEKKKNLQSDEKEDGNIK